MQLFEISSDDTNKVTHYDLADLSQAWQPPVDLSAPFNAAFELSESTIVSAELYKILRKSRYNVLIHDWECVNAVISPLAFDCWEGRSPEITRRMLLQAIKNSTNLDPRDHKTLIDLLTVH